jgi:hypothetical protein
MKHSLTIITIAFLICTTIMVVAINSLWPLVTLLFCPTTWIEVNNLKNKSNDEQKTGTGAR